MPPLEGDDDVCDREEQGTVPQILGLEAAPLYMLQVPPPITFGPPAHYLPLQPHLASLQAFYAPAPDYIDHNMNTIDPGTYMQVKTSWGWRFLQLQIVGHERRLVVIEKPPEGVRVRQVEVCFLTPVYTEDGRRITWPEGPPGPDEPRFETERARVVIDL